MKASFVILILATMPAISLGPYGASKTVSAVAQGPTVTLLADVSGWNFSQPQGTNPTIASVRLFVDTSFTANVKWVNSIHNLAVYLPGTGVLEVDPVTPCVQTPKCVAESGTVTFGAQQTSLTHIFLTHGLFEYYCEFHPDTMHGRIRVLKSPDINRDGTVNILDLVIVGGSFLATPSSPNWKPEADLNFDNVINILDLVVVAGNMFRTV